MPHGEGIPKRPKNPETLENTGFFRDFVHALAKRFPTSRPIPPPLGIILQYRGLYFKVSQKIQKVKY